MDDCPHPESMPLLLTPEEHAALTPTEERLILALIQYFSPDELAVLTSDDFSFFLSLEHETLPQISAQEAERIALEYRARVRLKLGLSPRVPREDSY